MSELSFSIVFCLNLKVFIWLIPAVFRKVSPEVILAALIMFKHHGLGAGSALPQWSGQGLPQVYGNNTVFSSTLKWSSITVCNLTSCSNDTDSRQCLWWGWCFSFFAGISGNSKEFTNLFLATVIGYGVSKERMEVQG